MVVLDATIVNVALPHIQRALGFSGTNLEWVVNAYALTFGGLLLLGGRAGDRLGRRKMFIAGLLLFSAASLAGGFANSEAFLLTARAVQGAGGALVAPAALALITTTFAEGPPRTRAFGVYAAMSIAGGAIGLIGGGLLTTYASWRWVLFVNVPIGAAVALAAPRVLAESPRRRGRFDLPGAITGTAGVTALVYGLISAATTPDGVSHWGDAKVIASLAAAAVLLAAFAVIETRSPQALLPVRLLRDRNRTGAYLSYAGVGIFIFGMFFFLTVFMQAVWGYSALKTGLAYLPFTAALFTGAGAVAQLVPKIGARPLLLAGSAASRRRPVLAVPDQRARHLRQRGARPDHDHRRRRRPAVRHAVPGRAEPRPRSRLRGGLQPAQHRPATRRRHRPGAARHRRLDRRRPQHPRPGRRRRAGRAPGPPGRPAGRGDLQPRPRHRVRPRRSWSPPGSRCSP